MVVVRSYKYNMNVVVVSGPGNNYNWSFTWYETLRGMDGMAGDQERLWFYLTFLYHTYRYQLINASMFNDLFRWSNIEIKKIQWLNLQHRGLSSYEWLIFMKELIGKKFFLADRIKFLSLRYTSSGSCGVTFWCD